ncbi:MAG TPA: hypothetical protein PK113_01870, partial [Bacillota bacterium]|nr:hypothetical protein [Bacillota bacterium]
IVTCLEPNVYFVWDADTLTEMVDAGEANAALLTERDPDLSYGRIIDLENQTEVWLTEPYFNMVKYNDEYNIGLYEDKLYLVNMTTGETLAAYDRYFELLKYFNIEPCIDDPNISETVDLTLINHYEIFIYNFSTYINSIDREVDFIFEDLSFIVWDLDYRKDNQMISTNGALIDKFGNVILEYPEGYLPYCIPISGMESYNPNIIYANSLIPMQPLGGGNDKAYMNLEGEIVANGLSQANPFYNGAALCAKEVAVSGGMAELYYTIDNTGNMTQIDIGMDYFSTITTDEGTIVRNGYVVMISRGVYHMLVRFENQEDGSGSGYDYIINTYGDVLATHISINSMNFFALNELHQLPDHYQIYFEDTQVKSDVIQILSGTGVNSLLVLLRNPYTGDHETETVVYDERFMTGEQRITHPFIFNFSESNQISVYLNDVLVDSSNYTWYEYAMHLYFDEAYIANQESNILNFHIISGTETADVTVYKENVPASMYEYIESMYQEVVVSYVDTTIIDVEIFNILDTGLIDTAYLCGEDISSTITSVTDMSEFNSVMVFINYQGVFTLEPGIYELYIGNATRMIHVYVHVE